MIPLTSLAWQEVEGEDGVVRKVPMVNPHSRLKAAKSLFHPFRTGPAVCAGCPRRVTVTPTSSGSLTHRPVSPLHPASTRARVQLTRASPNRR